MQGTRRRKPGAGAHEIDTDPQTLLSQMKKMSISCDSTFMEHLQQFIANVRKIAEVQGGLKIKKYKLNKTESNIQMVFKQLSDTEQIASKYFARQTCELLKLLKNNMKEIDPRVMYYICTVITLNMVNCHKSYIQKYGQNVILFIQLICCHISALLGQAENKFIKIDSEQNWKDMKLKTKQQIQIEKQVRNYSELVFSLYESFHMSQIFEKIKQVLYSGYYQGNSEQKASVLICLSSAYQIENDLDKVEDLIQFFRKEFQSQDKLARYYSICCFNKLVANFQKKFQEKYGTKFLSDIVNGLGQNDEKLLNQYLKLFSLMFLHYHDSSQIEPILEILIQFVCSCLEKSINQISKIASVQILFTLSTIPRLLTQARAKKCLEIYFTVLDQFSFQSHSQLLNKTCEFMAATIKNLETYFVHRQTEEVFKRLMQISGKISFKSLMDSWSSLCMTGVRVNDWKNLFQIIWKNLESISKGGTKLIEEEQISLYKAIQLTSECYQELLSNYSFQTLELLFLNEKNAVKRQSLKLILSLTSAINKIIQKSRSISVEKCQILMKEMIDFHFEVLLDGRQIFDQRIRMCSINSLKQIFVAYGSKFDPQFLQNFIEKVWEFSLTIKKLEDEEDQLSEICDQQQDQGSQLQDQQQYLADSDLGKCMESFINLLKVIIPVTHDKNQTLNKLLKQAKYWFEKNGKSQNYHIAQALVFIYLTLDTLPFQITRNHWSDFMTLFEKYKINVQAQVRQWVVLGIGSMIMIAPIEQINSVVISKWVSIVQTCYKIQKAKYQSEADYLCCQDFCISTIGKIVMKIKKIEDVKSLYNEWVYRLPLIHDHEQNKFQIQGLCKIILETPSQILIPDDAAVSQLVAILKVFTKLKIHYDQQEKNGQIREILKLISKTFRVMTTWPIFSQKNSEISAKLSPKDKIELQELLKL